MSGFLIAAALLYGAAATLALFAIAVGVNAASLHLEKVAAAIEAQNLHYGVVGVAVVAESDAASPVRTRYRFTETDLGPRVLDSSTHCIHRVPTNRSCEMCDALAALREEPA